MPSPIEGNMPEILPVKETVQALMERERLQLKRLENDKKDIDVQISVFGQIRSLFETLKEKLNKITDAFNTTAFFATSSDGDIVSASATNDILMAQSHEISVTQLAQAQRYQAQNAFSSKNAGLGINETLTFTSSMGSFNVSVASGDTLENIRDHINAAEKGVQASIISGSDGSGNPQYFLTLTASETGTANAFTISGDTGNYFNMLQKDAALDAKFTFDGINVIRSSNTVSDVLDGLELNIKATGDVTIDLTQKNDDRNKAIETAVNEMLDAYNKVVTYLDLANISAKDSSAYNIIKSSLGKFSHADFGQSGMILSEIGIVDDKYKTLPDPEKPGFSYITSGTMKIGSIGGDGSDTTRWKNALNDNFDKVEDFFTNDSSGFIAMMKSDIDSTILKSDSSSILYNAESTAKGQLSYYQKEIYSEESRLKIVEDSLTAKYTNLNVTLAKFENIDKYLEKQLSSLDGMFKK